MCSSVLSGAHAHLWAGVSDDMFAARMYAGQCTGGRRSMLHSIMPVLWASIIDDHDDDVANRASLTEAAVRPFSVSDSSLSSSTGPCASRQSPQQAAHLLEA